MIYSLMEFSERAAYEQKRGFIEYPYMHTLCEALEDAATGNLPNGAINLGISIAPRTYKTTFSSINFPAWCYGEIAPDCEWILTSSTAGLAEGNSMGVKKILHQEWYKDLYPEVSIAKDEKDTQKWFKTTAGGSVYGSGFDGTITGFGAGKTRKGFGGGLMIDDPIKARARRYPSQLEKCIDDYTGTMISRRNNIKTTPIFLIMQRICEGDLAGWIQENEDAEDWHWVIIPAVSDGEVINPTTMSTKVLNSIKRYDPATYYSQYQQDTKKSDKRMFLKSYWNFWKILPAMRRTMIYVDTAQKDKEKHDWSVFQYWGQGFDNHLYLIDQIRGKWLSPQLRKQGLDFWEKCRVTGASAMKIEDKVSGTDLIQTYSEKGIPIVAVQREIDKYTRMLDALPYIGGPLDADGKPTGNGNIYLPYYAEWVDDYIDEFWQAPDGDHDDQIDPTVDAIKDMLGSGAYNYAEII